MKALLSLNKKYEKQFHRWLSNAQSWYKFLRIVVIYVIWNFLWLWVNLDDAIFSHFEVGGRGQLRGLWVDLDAAIFGHFKVGGRCRLLWDFLKKNEFSVKWSSSDILIPPSRSWHYQVDSHRVNIVAQFCIPTETYKVVATSLAVVDGRIWWSNEKHCTVIIWSLITKVPKFYHQTKRFLKYQRSS